MFFGKKKKKVETQGSLEGIKGLDSVDTLGDLGTEDDLDIDELQSLDLGEAEESLEEEEDNLEGAEEEEDNLEGAEEEEDNLEGAEEIEDNLEGAEEEDDNEGYEEVEEAEEAEEAEVKPSGYRGRSSRDYDDAISFDDDEDPNFRSPKKVQVVEEVEEPVMVERKKKKTNTNRMELKLYILLDRPYPEQMLMLYVRNCGVKATDIFYNISDLRKEILLSEGACRIVIIETGYGKFTGNSSREEMVDMLDLCDEDTKITVFYTDNIIRDDCMRQLGDKKNIIEWCPYKNIVTALASIRLKNEEYVLDGEHEEAKEIDVERMLKSSGIRLGGIDEEEQIKREMFTVEEIKDNILNSDENEIEAFTPNYN